MTGPGTRILLCSLLLCWPTACAHRFTNMRVEKYVPDAGYRFKLFETGENNTNSLFVCLTFSGGGTRAAALAYGVLKELANQEIQWPAGGAKIRLLDEVDLISSVSGGAFTAAYYRVFGERIFQDFEKKFLYRDIEGELTRRALNPWNWGRLMSFWFDRIDLAAELYDRTIFDGKTFGDIDRDKPRPFVVINATNMAMGSQFPFTQDQFDLLGSDLDSYPIGNAVAASSAVPVMLSPVTLENHPAAKGYRLPEWIRKALARPRENTQQYRRAQYLAPYHKDKKNHPYIHLLDGGVSDNLGLGVLLDEFRQGFIQQLYHGIQADEDSPIERIDKLLLIVVNARTRLDESVDKSSTSPGMFSAAYNAANVSIDHHSFALLEIMQRSLNLTRKAQRYVEDMQKVFKRFYPQRRPSAPKLQKVQPYLVEINFDQIANPEKRDRYLNMPTSLALEPAQVDGLIRVAGKLLTNNEEYRRFLKDLAGKTPPGRARPPGQE